MKTLLPATLKQLGTIATDVVGDCIGFRWYRPQTSFRRIVCCYFRSRWAAQRFIRIARQRDCLVFTNAIRERIDAQGHVVANEREPAFYRVWRATAIAIPDVLPGGSPAPTLGLRCWERHRSGFSIAEGEDAMHHHAYAETLPTRGRLIRWARWYDAVVDVFTLGRAAALRRATVDLARIVPGERVLEVGCGTGAVCRVAASRTGPSGTVAGIDPAPEMIAVARAKAARAGLAIDYRVGVIEALPFADASFSVVFSSLMMHHLPDDLKRQGLAEIRRVLQPGGRLVIVDVQRPTTARAHLSAAIFMHGALSEGVQDLADVLCEQGFTTIQSGDMPLRMLGYLIGSTPTTSEGA